MDWAIIGTLIAACGVGIAFVAQLGRALHRFEEHVERQTELGCTVKTLTDAVDELRRDTRELKGVLRNGLNAKLDALRHTLEMQQERCKSNVARFEERLDRIER